MVYVGDRLFVPEVLVVLLLSQPPQYDHFIAVDGAAMTTPIDMEGVTSAARYEPSGGGARCAYENLDCRSGLVES